jgi:hypothetical protein
MYLSDGGVYLKWLSTHVDTVIRQEYFYGLLLTYFTDSNVTDIENTNMYIHIVS